MGDVEGAIAETLAAYGIAQATVQGGASPLYAEPGDFEGPDGLLVCGICGKPKEARCGELTFPVLHSHQLGALTRREETEDERRERIARNRERCFKGEFYEEGERDLFAVADPDTPALAVQECKSFVASFADDRRGRQGRGLILHGPVGRGKTFLAGCVCNSLLADGWRCLMTSTRRIRSRIESSYGSSNEVVERLCRFDLVVLDDLFRDRDTEAGREIVFTVIDALYKMRVPVIATTNASADFLAYPPGELQAAVDRLKERCHRVPVDGPNRRQAKAL